MAFLSSCNEDKPGSRVGSGFPRAQSPPGRQDLPHERIRTGMSGMAIDYPTRNTYLPAVPGELAFLVIKNRYTHTHSPV